MRKVRVKVLRYVWEQGWSGAVSMPPWPDRVYVELFDTIRARLSNSAVSAEFDLADWAVLVGGVHERLRDSRDAIIAACRRQADSDGIALAGYDHVVMFVHEAPADSGVRGADAVFDQTYGGCVADVCRMIGAACRQETRPRKGDR